MLFFTDTTWGELTGKFYPINKIGKRIAKLKFDKFERLENGFMWLKKDFDYGLVNPHFKLIIRCKYDGIKFEDGKFYGLTDMFDEQYVELEVD